MLFSVAFSAFFALLKKEQKIALSCSDFAHLENFIQIRTKDEVFIAPTKGLINRYTVMKRDFRPLKIPLHECKG